MYVCPCVYVVCSHSQKHTHTHTQTETQSQHALAPHDITHTPHGTKKPVENEKMGRQAVFAKAHYPQKCVRVFSAFALPQHLSVWLAPHSLHFLTLSTFLLFLVNFFSPYFAAYIFYLTLFFFWCHASKGASASNCYNGPEIFMGVCEPVIYLLYNAPQFPHRTLIFPGELRLLCDFFASISGSHNCGLFTFFSGANFSCELG